MRKYVAKFPTAIYLPKQLCGSVRPKPKSNFSIGIRAKTFLSETETLFFLISFLKSFYDIENKPRESKNIQYSAVNLVLGTLL